MKPHKITISNAATNLLVSALSNIRPGWIESVNDLAISSCLLGGTFGEFDAKYVPHKVTGRDGKETEIEVLDAAWAKATAEHSFSEKERDTVKRCLTALAKKGTLPPGKPALELLSAFGLTPE